MSLAPETFVGRCSWMCILPGNARCPQSGHHLSPSHSPARRAALRGLRHPCHPAGRDCVSQPSDSSVSPALTLQNCRGGPGSLSPGWQSRCCASNPDWCPDCGDGYHKTHPHKQARGGAEDWLLAPSGEHLQKASMVALRAQGSSGRARSSGRSPSEPQGSRGSSGLRERHRVTKVTQLAACPADAGWQPPCPRCCSPGPAAGCSPPSLPGACLHHPAACQIPTAEVC